MALFKIIGNSTAEANEKCVLETTKDSQWTKIDIRKGETFYIIEQTDSQLFLEGRQNGDFVQFYSDSFENGKLDELSEAVGQDVFYKSDALLNGETVTIVGCAICMMYNWKPMAELADGRIVDPSSLSVRPSVLGDLATVDCGL